MVQTPTVRGTDQEIIEYLQNNGKGLNYSLIEEAPTEEVNPDAPKRRLSFAEMRALLAEAGLVGRGRTNPSLKYDREDIYFDR